MSSMRRLRRRFRRTTELARLLATLDSIASERRPSTGRAAARVAVGRGSL
jgi:hypothetical protein